jgi:hypothetical protein
MFTSSFFVLGPKWNSTSKNIKNPANHLKAHVGICCIHQLTWRDWLAASWALEAYGATGIMSMGLARLSVTPWSRVVIPILCIVVSPSGNGVNSATTFTLFNLESLAHVLYNCHSSSNTKGSMI